jgi:hypothetical protein
MFVPAFAFIAAFYMHRHAPHHHPEPQRHPLGRPQGRFRLAGGRDADIVCVQELKAQLSPT